MPVTFASAGRFLHRTQLLVQRRSGPTIHRLKFRPAPEFWTSLGLTT